MRSSSPCRPKVVRNGLSEGVGVKHELKPGDVILALARPVEAVEPKRSRLLSILSSVERQRFERFRFERDRDLFLVSHALVRISLSKYADVRPEVWRFRAGSHGRPEISEPPSRMRFNLSHTHGLAVCAIMLDHDLGVDVEYLGASAPMEVGERFFSPRELADINSVSSDGRVRSFFEYWTLKEAYTKARGVGLSLPLPLFSFYRDANKLWRFECDSSVLEDPRRWEFWSSNIEQDWQVAVAMDRGQTEMLPVKNAQHLRDLCE